MLTCECKNFIILLIYSNLTIFRLFGNQDVDLRTTTMNEVPIHSEKKALKVRQGIATKTNISCKIIQKDKSDFEAVRAKLKLNASNSRHKRGGIKILDELPRALSPIENGNATSEIRKKMLQKKKGDLREDVHDNHQDQQVVPAAFEEQNIRKF